MNTIEIERKFLLEYPDLDCLSHYPDLTRWAIRQTYLTSTDDSVRRIRQVIVNDRTHYYLTEKSRNPGCMRFELEEIISKEQYEKLLQERDPACKTLVKDRYRFTYKDKVFELDLFEGTKAFALLEVELENESESFTLPPEFVLIREVTNEASFYNHELARNWPTV